jgi:hypothetical protein
LISQLLTPKSHGHCRSHLDALDCGTAPHGGGGAQHANLRTVVINGVAPRGVGSAGFVDLVTEVKDRAAPRGSGGARHTDLGTEVDGGVVPRGHVARQNPVSVWSVRVAHTGSVSRRKLGMQHLVRSIIGVLREGGADRIGGEDEDLQR